MAELEIFKLFLTQYGLAGLGWPLFLYVLWKSDRDRKKRDALHRDDLREAYGTIKENTKTLSSLKEILIIIRTHLGQ